MEDTLLTNISHKVNVSLELLNDGDKIKLLCDSVSRTLLQVHIVEQVVLAVLRWFDEQVSPALTQVRPANHVLGMISELYTHHVISLTGAQHVVVQLLILQLLSVGSRGLICPMVRIATIEHSFVVLGPGDVAELDLLQGLRVVFSRLNIPDEEKIFLDLKYFLFDVDST